MIPKHCIDIFINKFKFYPSVIEISPENIKGDLIKFLNKFNLLYFEDLIDGDGKNKNINRLYEYDSTGILVYINQDGKIFILTTVDRKSVSEFLINNLKKIK